MKRVAFRGRIDVDELSLNKLTMWDLESDAVTVSRNETDMEGNTGRPSNFSDSA